jgi:MarR family transcriptional regulator, organic hydroperoxide resistance regulator
MKSSASRFSKCLYFSANALARKIEKLAAESWKKINLSPSHAYLLLTVIEEPGVQPGTLAAEMQLTPSTITRLIEKLEAEKLLVRTVEGKVTNVYPTPKAKELYPKMKVCLNEFYKNYTLLAGVEETYKMIQNIHKLNDKLTV